MSNMSYCRFRNTLNDLLDCEDALEAFVSEDLSEEEEVAKWRLIKTCTRISQEHDPEAPL